MAQVPDGPPLHFSWRRKKHIVAHAEGPERIAQEWWRTGEAAARDYYRIEDSEGRRFWLFRIGFHGDKTGAPRWYLHGQFA
jgi:protein ImuB